MAAIGGYFELELRRGRHYHEDAIRLNTARNCFEYVLLARGYRKVYIPYYTCEVMLQPLQKHHIAYEFYHIDQRLEPVNTKPLQTDEAFLYTNYFGLKQRCVEKLASLYGRQLIVDNAQAFFAPRLKGIDTFYSPRKFFGVPDGGYLYTDYPLAQELSQDKSVDRMSHLLCRIEEGAEAGYGYFRKNDDMLDNNPIRKMSVLTSRLLANVDYEAVYEKRRANFQYLHELLGGSNQLSIGYIQDEDVPLVYPYYNTEKNELKQRLIQNKIFIATYWPNVADWCDEKAWESKLTQQLCCLPIDQRYGAVEMNDIVKNVK